MVTIWLNQVLATKNAGEFAKEKTQSPSDDEALAVWVYYHKRFKVLGTVSLQCDTIEGWLIIR